MNKPVRVGIHIDYVVPDDPKWIDKAVKAVVEYLQSDIMEKMIDVTPVDDPVSPETIEGWVNASKELLDPDGELEAMHCRECGERMVLNGDGTSSHLTEDDEVNHDLDADHVAVAEDEPDCSTCGHPIRRAPDGNFRHILKEMDAHHTAEP